jgi:hypothetical protein
MLNYDAEQVLFRTERRAAYGVMMALICGSLIYNGWVVETYDGGVCGEQGYFQQPEYNPKYKEMDREGVGPLVICWRWRWRCAAAPAAAAAAAAAQHTVMASRAAECCGGAACVQGTTSRLSSTTSRGRAAGRSSSGCCWPAVRRAACRRYENDSQSWGHQNNHGDT